TTDSFGNYSFSSLANGTYQVQEMPQGGYTQSSSNPVNINIVNNDTSLTTNFGNFQLFTISGTVFNDANNNGSLGGAESGLPGWTVYLDGSNGGTVNNSFDSGEASTVTDSFGNYTFTGQGPGSYHVREITQNGWSQSSTNVDFTGASGV